MKTSHLLLGSFTAVLLAASLAPGAQAADRKARLVIDVKIDSKGRASNGVTGESGEGSSTQELHTSVTLSSNGVLEDSNRNDIAGNGAKMEKQLKEAQARQPDQSVMKERQLRLRNEMMECKTDIACINRVSGQYAKDTAAWNVKPPPPGEERYLTYAGYQGCQGDFHAKINSSRKGTFPDVQGPVPFTETASADYTAAGTDKAQLCHVFNYLVVDTKAGTIYPTLGILPIKGKHMRTEGGRKLFASDEASDLRLHSDAMDWVRSKLNGAPRSGKERTTLKLTTKPGEKGSRDGTVDIELSWRLEDI